MSDDSTVRVLEGQIEGENLDPDLRISLRNVSSHLEHALSHVVVVELLQSANDMAYEPGYFGRDLEFVEGDLPDLRHTAKKWDSWRRAGQYYSIPGCYTTQLH